ncbi:hypothetical protein ADL22_06355 [Streptomyces sp. NRRL F-4489]|uniref:hypothetical protein n=1 Tax=Streptomyces sp. NRRL F-4489 TaxID=1609095 RepID=UPI0007464BA6|nr:hypothetical protein [Streptomyces sp. NRRL F-4489]KUL51413.1 hypothetical protein ADL22_06355 [Streptomyces sp. NRRL F-4489]
MATTTPPYEDHWITCTEDAVRVRGYYFPWGTKTIPYTKIRGVRRREMGMLTGQGRIWGTGHPRYWASLDPERMSKSTALILDLGRYVRPFLTPDDPDAVEAVIRERAGLPAAEDGDGR